MLQDFSTYTEVDPNGKLSRTATRYTWASLHQGEDAYAYMDFGVDNLDGDIRVELTHSPTAIFDVGGTGITYFCVFANLIDDLQGIRTAGGDALGLMSVHIPGPYWLIALTEIDGGFPYEDNSVGLSEGTPYYIKFIRDDSVGTYGTAYAYIYDDEAMTSLVDTLQLTLHGPKKDFRYFYAVQSRNAGDPAQANEASGYVENVTIFGAGAPTVTTDPASALSAIAATLNGTLDSGAGEACVCGFEWGLDTGYGNTTPTESKTIGESFSQVIRGLFPGTTYHFRAFATNSAGTSYGADRSFATELAISKGYALDRGEL